MIDRDFKTRFFRGSAFSMAGTVLMLVFHFLSMKLLAEYMPLEDFGVFALLMVISQGLVVLSGLGLALTLVKNISGEVEITKQQQVVTGVIVTRAAQLLLLSAVICLCGRTLLKHFFGDVYVEFLVFLPFMFGLAICRETLFNILQGRNQFHMYALIKVLSAVARLLAILGLSQLHRLGVRELVWVEIITSSATVAVLVPFSQVVSLFRPARFDWLELKGILRFSTPLFANDMFNFAYQGVSVLLLGAFLAPGSVALYAIATKIPEALARVLNSLLVVYFPAMSELMAKARRDDGAKLMNLALGFVSAAISLVALTIFLFRTEVVLLLFSPQYLDAAPVLSLLMLSFVLSGLRLTMASTSIASGQSSVPLRVNVISSMINISACVALIPVWGVMGAVAAQIFANVAAQLLYWRNLGIAQLTVRVQEIGRPLVIGLAVAAIFTASGAQSVIIRIVLVATFALLCWLFVPAVRRCCEYGSSYLTKFSHQLSRVG